MEAPVQVEERLLTAEEFYDLYAGQDFELVRGRVVEARSGLPISGWYTQTAEALGLPVAGEAMTNPIHGLLQSRLSALLENYLAGSPVGKVVANTGFILKRNPDITRAPDVAFVTTERIGTNPIPERGFWEVAPDLAVEIVSPDDRADAAYEKVQEYLRAGVRLVWVIYPRQRKLHRFRPVEVGSLAPDANTLSGEDVLPGFELRLQQLWSVLD
jgi:Uma2 family endonuclease